MSDVQNTQPNELLTQNHMLGNLVNQLQGQVNYLQGLVETNHIKPAEAKYPSTDMPDAPIVPGAPIIPPNMFRANGEGVIDVPTDPAMSLVPPPPAGKMRILIGVPMLAVSFEFFESFLKFWTELVLKGDPRYEISYLFAYRKPVHMAEEWLIKQAQYNKCTHILLMDDDIFDVTAADLNKLPHAMCTFRRYDRSKRVIDMPADTSMYRLYEIPCTCTKCNHPQSHWDVKFCPVCGETLNLEIQPVDLVPFPFTLIDLKVFDKIKLPWFHCTNGYPTDSWFCDRCLEVGIQPYAHMTVRLNHAGITDATKPHFMQMGMVKAQQSKAVVHLSPQQMDLHQSLLFNKMKEVEESTKPKPAFASEGKLASGEIAKDLTLVTSIAR